MGYTHYWRTRMTTDPQKLAAAHWDVVQIVRASKVPLANGHGDVGSEPIISEGVVIFNGVGDDAHETFSWPPNFTDRFPDHSKGETWETPVRTGELICMPDESGFGFEFCKTARKPYDAVVTACLIAVKRHLGDDVEVSSDGTEDEFMNGAGNYSFEQVNPETGAELFERVFGYRPECPFTDEEA